MPESHSSEALSCARSRVTGAFSLSGLLGSPAAHSMHPYSPLMTDQAQHDIAVMPFGPGTLLRQPGPHQVR